MKSYCINKFIVLMLGTILFAGLPAGPTRAATEEPIADEQALMALFYEEDDLVEAATRSPKPISQVAENVTIVTAEEIEAMNAHTVAEVLNRVTGVAVEYYGGQDFAGPSVPIIHGSDYERILVLVDSVRWRYVTADYPETNTIPVHIIKRIEVIKGPASSTWGSSYGGVINIITKDTGMETRPSGRVSASYGESSSYEVFAEAAGRLGLINYYLYGGRQSSDGLRDNKYIDTNRFYSKLDLEPRDDVCFSFTLGYSKPENRALNDAIGDFTYYYEDRAFFYTGALDWEPSQDLHFNVTLHTFEDKLENRFGRISDGFQYSDESFDGTTRGVDARLVWNHPFHTLVVGGEFLRDKTIDTEHLWMVGPVTNRADNWAVFINDTMVFGRLTVVPGLRYDDLGLSDNFVSPSLGATYRLNNNTLLRGQLAYGFRKPPINHVKETIYGPIHDPDLQAEEVRSIQVGAESSALKWLKLKATLFHHDVEKVWDLGGTYFNNGDVLNKGFEVEALTLPFYYFTLAANYTYVDMDSDIDGEGRHKIANFILEYDNPQIFFAQLYGHYVRWGDVLSPPSWNGKDGNFLWDLNLRKTILQKNNTALEVFATVHNITDDAQYSQEGHVTNPRWVEAGIRIHY